jgi:hypothetical protein
VAERVCGLSKVSARAKASSARAGKLRAFLLRAQPNTMTQKRSRANDRRGTRGMDRDQFIKRITAVILAGPA